jgi:hypothetical protein
MGKKMAKVSNFFVMAFQHRFRMCCYEVKTKQDALKLNGTPQRLVYADDDSMLGVCIHTIQKTQRNVISC